MTKGKKILAHAVLILASFLSVFPLYYMLCGATNTSIDVVRGKLIPGTYLVENFKSLVANQNLGLAMANSFRNAILMTLITLLVCSIAGYGFEIYHDKAKDALMSVLLLAMMLPFVAIMIPLFKMMSHWGLVNSWAAFVLPSISTPFMIMLFRQASRSFPNDIIEAARLDGLSEIGIFFRMFVPIMTLYLRRGDDCHVYERMEQLPLAEGRIPKQRIHHNADAGRKPQERLQCGLRYADAGRSDLHAAHRNHLPLPAEELCQRHHGCSQVMDERTYCLTPEQWRHAKACLTLAKRWGLIDDDSPEALERRRAAKNAQAERAEQDGKPVYGTRRFSAPAYLQYELTRFKLDFAEPCEKIRALGICPDFTDAQTRAWYDANPDLFTRYAGDSFPYEEVKQIIEKRMREEVYDSLVQDLLRGPADRP